jgi:hypothetical protein
MRKVTAQESRDLATLVDRLGSVRLRTLLTEEDSRLLRPDRLLNLTAGRGRISESEASRLRLVKRNAREIELLARKETKDEKKGRARKAHKVNRALRDWLTHGKERGIAYGDQESDIKADQITAIKALRFFGVDPVKGQYYVKKVAA